MQEQPPTFLERLQGLSHATKSRILLVAVMVSLVGLGALWVRDTSRNLSGLDTNNILPSGSVLSATNYVTIESYEQQGDKHRIYFKVYNNTSDILNFSRPEQVSLQINGKTVTPESVTDRQQAAFVSKVLSNTTVYGVLVFGQINGNGGVLDFDEMFFENQPANVFRESIDIDFKDLPPVEELRS